MALPESAGVGIIEGEFLVGTSGLPDSGSVTFKPRPSRVSIEDATVTVSEVVATLDAAGKLSVELIATDDPDHAPRDLLYLAVFDLGSGPQSPLWVVCPSGETSSFEDVIVHPTSPPWRCQPMLRGPRGLSAYQVALAGGFVGTEAQWLASLVGAPGTDGTNGTDGTDGTDGTNGTDGADGVANIQIVPVLPPVEDQLPGVFYAVQA